MYNLPLSGYYDSFIRPDIRVHLNPFNGSPPGDPANKVTGYPVEKMYNLPLSGYYGSFIRPDIRVHLNPFKGSPNIRFFYFGSAFIRLL